MTQVAKEFIIKKNYLRTYEKNNENIQIKLFKIKSNEAIDLDETEEVIDLAYRITAYGADYPVDSLVKRLNNKDVLVIRLHGCLV
ncbi:MAG: hypothetical protein U5J95_03565 [Balneolaceae bacterium]|nr:hypothetical protein [Balneolaceae bacterium]